MASGRERVYASVLSAMIVLSVVALAVSVAGSATAATITVSEGESIQSAIDSARDGDRIEVEPGTYEEPIDITKNVTLVAPDGATIANTSAIDSRAGLQIFGSARPEISGFTLTDWRWAVSAGPSEGGWLVRDVVITGGNCGVCAAGTESAWTIDNVTITDVETAVSGYDSSAAWMITDTVITGNSDEGVLASESSGDWIIQNTTVQVNEEGITAEESTGEWLITDTTINNSFDGIDAENATGAWKVTNTTIRNTLRGVEADHTEGAWRATNVTIFGDASADDSVGIDAKSTTGSWQLTQSTIEDVGRDGVTADVAAGEWTIRNTTIHATRHSVDLFETSGDWLITSSVLTSTNEDRAAVNAYNTTGNWQISRSRLTDGTGRAISAADTAPRGNASYNYWGASDGPSGEFNGSGGRVTGNVTVTPFYTDRSLTTLNTDSAGDGTDSDDPVAAYTTEEGIVDAPGLLDAAADFRNGEIEADVLLDVASAFRSNEPV